MEKNEGWYSSTHPFAFGSETYTRHGFTSLTDNKWKEDAVAEWAEEPTTPSPIRTVSKREIVEGTFGRVQVLGEIVGSECLIGLADREGNPLDRGNFSIAELRTMSGVLTQIADVLEENSK